MQAACDVLAVTDMLVFDALSVSLLAENLHMLGTPQQF